MTHEATDLGQAYDAAPLPSNVHELRTSLDLWREADDVIAEALGFRRDAVQKAEQIIREAEGAALMLEDAARTEALAMVADAEREAERLLADARARAAETSRRAEESAEALESDTGRRRFRSRRA